MFSDPDSCRLSIDKIAQNHLVLPKSASTGKAYSNGDSIPTRCKTNYYRASPALTVECLDGEMIYPKCTQESKYNAVVGNSVLDVGCQYSIQHFFLQPFKKINKNKIDTMLYRSVST